MYLHARLRKQKTGGYSVPSCVRLATPSLGHHEQVVLGQKFPVRTAVASGLKPAVCAWFVLASATIVEAATSASVQYVFRART